MPYSIEFRGGPVDGRTNQYHCPDQLPQAVRIRLPSDCIAVYRLIVVEIPQPAEFGDGKLTAMDFAYQLSHYE